MWEVQVLQPLGNKVHAEPCFWGGSEPPPPLTRGMVDVGSSSFGTPLPKPPPLTRGDDYCGGVHGLEPLGNKVHAEPCFWGGSSF